MFDILDIQSDGFPTLTVLHTIQKDSIPFIPKKISVQFVLNMYLSVFTLIHFQRENTCVY